MLPPHDDPDFTLHQDLVGILADTVEKILTMASKKQDIARCDLRSFDAFSASLAVAFDRALRDLATRHRASNPTACDRIPLEILPEIFQYLPMKGVTSASQTCRAWRVACLQCSRLWTTLDLWTTVTGRPGFAPVGGSNLRFAVEAIARTRHLPFSVNLTTNALSKPLADWFVHTFAYVLAPHRERLISLHIDHKDPSLITRLSPFLETLVSLRNLTLTAPGRAYRNIWDPPKFPHGSLTLPALEELIMHVNFRWSTNSDASFPLLRAITISLADDNDIAAMVSACPALQLLHIRIHCDSEFSLDDSFMRLDRIPLVAIHNLRECERDLRSFIQAPRRFLWLSWFEEQTEPYDALSAVTNCFPTFSVVLTFLDYEVLNVRCIDAQGRERLLSFWKTLSDLNKSFSLWKRLAPSSLLGLTIQPLLWHGVTRELPQVPKLTSLGFLISQPGELAPISHAPGTEGDPKPIFVSLEVLHLRAWLCALPVRISAEEVSRVVRTLNLGRPLPCLVLHGVLVDDPSAIEGVAKIDTQGDAQLPFTPVDELPEDFYP